MAKKKYRRYSAEYKRHALKRASEDGLTDRGVCDDEDDVLVNYRQYIVLVVGKGIRCKDHSGQDYNQCGEAAASFKFQHRYHSLFLFLQ